MEAVGNDVADVLQDLVNSQAGKGSILDEEEDKDTDKRQGKGGKGEGGGAGKDKEVSPADMEAAMLAAEVRLLT